MRPFLSFWLLLSVLTGCERSPTDGADPLARREVAYQFESSVHVSRLNGSSVRTLTGGERSSGTPVWSRDGRRIFFVASGPEGYDVYRMDADGTDAVQLTVGGGNDSPSPDPSGERIVHRRQDFQTELRIREPDGSHRTIVSAGTPTTPTWSPDGQWIVFRDGSPGRTGLWRVRPDGSGLTQITTESCFDPAWAPDSRRVVCSRTVAGARVLVVVDVSDGSTSQITQDRGEYPDWSADGWISFRGGSGLAALRPDGSDRRELGWFPGNHQVRWRP